MLWRQRYRWSYGTMQSIWKHRSAIWSPGEGRIGRRGLPYMVLFQVALPMHAPLIIFNLLQFGLGCYAAFRLDKESPRVLWPCRCSIVYRQLMYLVVIESMISAAARTRIRGQHLERTGEVEVPAEATGTSQ